MAATSPVEGVATPGAVGVVTSAKQLMDSSSGAPEKLHVVFFWAEYNPATTADSQNQRLLKMLAAKEADVAFFTANVDHSQTLVDMFDVQATPTFAFFKGGVKVATETTGAAAAVVKCVANGKLFVVSEEDKAGQLKARLTALTTAAPVMLFMKGTPEAPRCKFSRACVDLMAKHGVQYSSFDVLADPAVRAGLKEFSKWPTYPQLYHKGELVGGLDIMKEMDEEGELASTLAVAPTPAPAPAATPTPAVDLKARLTALTTQAPVVLFMKGNPAAPQCGFSSTAIELLRAAGIKGYATFDILSDPAVRAGLKEFSKWPTYPQLYHHGELVGGLDIMKELHEEGELAELAE